MSENNRCYLKIYIGTPEDDWEDYMYLDLIVPGRDVTLYCSKNSLNTDSAQDLLDELEKTFNEARMYAKSLGLKVRVETEEILAMAEEAEESASKSVKNLLKEMED